MNRVKLSILTLAATVPLAGSVLASAAGPNLLQNGNFTTDTAGWTNFSGNPSVFKNTLKLTNAYDGDGNSYYSATQCVKNVNDKSKYTVEGQTWVPKASVEFGGAGIYLHFYAGPNCDGAPLGGGHASGGFKESQRGEWLALKHGVEAPDGSHSVIVRPTAIKEPKAPANSAPGTLTVYFDNLKLTEQKALVMPEPKPDDDFPIVNPEVTPDPDPQPEDKLPEANPEVTPDPDPQPEDQEEAEEPVVESTDSDDSQDEPAAEDTDKPADIPSANGDGSGGGQQSTTSDPKTVPTTAPLPPETGESATTSSDSNTILYGALATCFAGLGLIIAVLFRRSRPHS
jgi:hypothetical protein